MKTIITVDQLEALDPGAVIHESAEARGWLYELTEDGVWTTTGTRGAYDHTDIALPATLIYPRTFDTEDVERLAKALPCVFRIPSEGHPRGTLCVREHGCLDQARAALATLGEVVES